MFDAILGYVSGSPVTYGITAGICALDAFFPIVPSETVVIAASIVALRGELLIWLVLAAAAIGAFTGDNISYLLGDKLGEPAAERLFKSDKAKRRLDRPKAALHERGAVIIVAGLDSSPAAAPQPRSPRARSTCRTAASPTPMLPLRCCGRVTPPRSDTSAERRSRTTCGSRLPSRSGSPAS